MFIENGDGTYTAGPLDVAFIYHNVLTDTYHVVVYEESPMPGPITPVGDLITVRLKSKMHHTQGASTLEGAQGQLAELRREIIFDDPNVNTTDPIPWSGQLGDVMLVPNWRSKGEERNFSPAMAV